MNIEALIPSTVDGLMLGFVYGLAAMGLTLIFGVMRVVNLAHGAVIAIGMFVVLLVATNLGLGPYVGVAAAAVAGLGFGIVMYLVAVDRVIAAPEVSTLLATYAVSLMIIGLGTAIFTTSPYTVPVDLGSITVGNVTIMVTHAIAVVISVAAAAALWAFLFRTRTGKSIRAVANDRAAAELMGIDSRRMLALSFGVGTALAMTGGALLATLFSFTILSGEAYQVKSFVIVVLGGLGSPLGALVGGLILGLLEGVTSVFIPVSWVPVIEYAIFIGILLVRPWGLFGQKS
jgi:branched-subunit amino acid ABC-type transport system permease component